MPFNGIVNIAKQDFMMGVHQQDDLYALALYTQDQVLGPDTFIYTNIGELVAEGYQPGGIVLQGQRVDLTTNAETLQAVATMNFQDPVWQSVSFQGVIAAMLYNKSKDNAAISILDFGGPQNNSNGPFTIELSKLENGLVQIK